MTTIHQQDSYQTKFEVKFKALKSLQLLDSFIHSFIHSQTLAYIASGKSCLFKKTCN